MSVEPRQGAGDNVALVLGIGKEVALVFVNHELRLDAERLQGMPEFVGLRGGNLAVAIADEGLTSGSSPS